MNVIQRTVKDICAFRINRQILEYAYAPMNVNWRRAPTTIEEYITNSVIKARVMPMCNMYGGTEVLVPVDDLQRQVVDDFTSLYYVPPHLVNNREIVSALSITFHSYNMGYTPGGYVPNLSGVSNPFVNPGLSLMNAADVTSLFSNAQLEVVDGNTILVRNTNGFVNMGFFRLLVGNSMDMSTIGLTALPVFMDLCTLAVKSHIYVKTRVKLDMGKLEAGHELGAIREEIEKFADSEELFQTMLREKWGKVSKANDQLTMDRLLRLQITAGAM